MGLALRKVQIVRSFQRMAGIAVGGNGKTVLYRFTIVATGLQPCQGAYACLPHGEADVLSRQEQASWKLYPDSKILLLRASSGYSRLEMCTRYIDARRLYVTAEQSSDLEQQ